LHEKYIYLPKHKIMNKKAVGRPKKMDAEKLVTVRTSVKKRHEKEFQKIIDNLANRYR
jgi:hypothetical protein